MKRFIRLPSRSRGRIERDVADELDFHLRERAEALVASGFAPDEALRQAEQEFGDIRGTRRFLTRFDNQTEHMTGRRDYFGDLRQDIWYALRALRRAPGFTATAVLTLALGIGANIAIFSVVNGVLLRPLPFPRPEALYRVWSAGPNDGVTRAAVSAVDLDDWRAQRRAILDMGGFWYAAGGSGIDMLGRGEPRRLSAVFTTAGFYGTLAMTPAVGRVPREDELVRGGRDRVVMLSHAFWEKEFGGDSAVVGTSLTLGSEAYEVLGVMPAGLSYPAPDVDVFVPYSTIPDAAIPRIRPTRILDVVARARDGVTRAAVEQELQAITARLAREYPENAALGSATVVPLHEALTGNVRTGLFLLSAAVMLVLLIACVNVASLQLARGSVRGRELAVRRALGASGGRIVRQLLTESMVLSLVGGVAGVALAALSVRALQALGTRELPRGSESSLDGTVLAFALALSVLSGILFGLVPAWRSAASAPQRALRDAARGIAGDGATRLRSGLVVAEVALALMLVAGGAVMTRSFMALLHVDPGFRPDHTVVLNYTLSDERHQDYTITYQQVLERVRAVPGVVGAASMKDAPLRGVGERIGFRLPGMTIPAGEEGPSAASLHVSDDIFRTLGTRLVSGREFAPTDRRGAPFVMVVNEAFARRWFPGQEALGKSLLFGESTSAEIVGVVGDIRQRSMAEAAEPTVYIHVPQNGRVRMNLVVRTRGEPLALGPAIRNAIWSVDRLQTITSIFTLDQALGEAVARPRLLMVLMAAFGVLGLALGALGLYGVLSYLVNQRRREIGVRLALGADVGRVRQMVVGYGLRLTAIGVVLGLAGAVAAGRLLGTLVYGVNPVDPALLALVSLTLLGVAAASSWAPARRASLVDPAVTLREE
ncbi:MAG: ABC transporter permease [Gemmatimonadaceae bacterium]|nr:ABC transporter permease [Gemmatimonadaceae bacterium]